MNWFTVTASSAIEIVISAFLIYIIMMMFVKLNGLRSFSKMSAHDFAVTIAIGSILGSVAVSPSTSVMQGLFAIGAFLLFQGVYSLWRLKRPEAILENEPLLLMSGETILDDNLKTAKITHADLMAKLREANVLTLSEVKAVVFESTGDVSVLHGDKEVDACLLANLRR